MSTIGNIESLERSERMRPMTFPEAQFAVAASFFDAYADETARAAKSVQGSALDQAAEIMLQAYTRGSRVFSCGNGGSAAIANHLQCDHMKAISASTGLTPRVISLSTNVELLTAIANDTAYENVFLHQLQWQAVSGDVLIAISSSGRSANIVNAITWARDHGLTTIALTGFDGGEAKRLSQVSIHVDAANYGIIEDLHQAVMHALAQYIRQSKMPSDAIAEQVF